jgi:hypothetical protein
MSGSGNAMSPAKGRKSGRFLPFDILKRFSGMWLASVTLGTGECN